MIFVFCALFQGLYRIQVPVFLFFLFQKMYHARLSVLTEVIGVPAPFTYVSLAVIFFAVIFHFFVKTPSYT